MALAAARERYNPCRCCQTNPAQKLLSVGIVGLDSWPAQWAGLNLNGKKLNCLYVKNCKGPLGHFIKWIFLNYLVYLLSQSDLEIDWNDQQKPRTIAIQWSYIVSSTRLIIHSPFVENFDFPKIGLWMAFRKSRACNSNYLLEPIIDPNAAKNLT